MDKQELLNLIQSLPDGIKIKFAYAGPDYLQVFNKIDEVDTHTYEGEKAVLWLSNEPKIKAV
jgi:hypothetical protein